MKDILTAPFVQEMMQTTANMYRLGWDERNGGNISMMLDPDEVAEYLDINAPISELSRPDLTRSRLSARYSSSPERANTSRTFSSTPKTISAS